MTSAERTDDCARMTRIIELYLDGEVEPAHSVEAEHHLRCCSTCTEHFLFLRAMRSSVRRASQARTPEHLHAVVRKHISNENEEPRARRQRDLSPSAPRLIDRRYSWTLAAAAMVALLFGASDHFHPTASLVGASAARVASAGFDSMVDDLVALHARPLPPETTNLEELVRFDPLVGFRVRRPAFALIQATFRGARVHAMHEQRLAVLQYTVAGEHRVTMYVFDPSAVPIRATHLEPRVVRERPVYVGTLRGYSVAAAERAGVGYMLASDLNSDDNTQLALTAAQQ